jgi:hypothetical protein
MKKKAKAQAKPKKVPKKEEVITIPVVDHTPVDEMQALAKKAKASIEYTRGLFPKLLTLTEDERRTSNGKLREDEEKALRAVLEVAKSYPQYFTVLADLDHGDDPTVFEHQLLVDRIERRAALVEVATTLEELLGQFTDTILRIGELVREPCLEAYRIAKPISQRDAKVRALLAPALDFYGQLGKKAQKTKQEKAKAGKPGAAES